jgi:hypothetical protein
MPRECPVDVWQSLFQTARSIEAMLPESLVSGREGCELTIVLLSHESFAETQRAVRSIRRRPSRKSQRRLMRRPPPGTSRNAVRSRLSILGRTGYRCCWSGLIAGALNGALSSATTWRSLVKRTCDALSA